MTLNISTSCMIQTCLTCRASVATSTLTSMTVDTICASATIQTRVAVAFINICIEILTSVCVYVRTFVARWLHSETWCQVRSRLSTRTQKWNTTQEDLFLISDNMDHPNQITFWPIT